MEGSIQPLVTVILRVCYDVLTCVQIKVLTLRSPTCHRISLRNFLLDTLEMPFHGDFTTNVSWSPPPPSLFNIICCVCAVKEQKGVACGFEKFLITFLQQHDVVQLFLNISHCQFHFSV